MTMFTFECNGAQKLIEIKDAFDGIDALRQAMEIANRAFYTNEWGIWAKCSTSKYHYVWVQK